MGPANCAVVGCYNSTAKKKKWETTPCDIVGHGGALKKDCPCDPPFQLYCFPGPIRYADKRKEWIRLLKRETVKKKPWAPCSSDRVCSEHFVDGVPTVQNPNPSLKLGYDSVQKPKRRELFRKQVNEKTPMKDAPNEVTFDNDSSVLLSPPFSPPPLHQLPKKPETLTSPDHDYCRSVDNPQPCATCVVKQVLITKYRKKVENQTRIIQKQKRQLDALRCCVNKKKPFSVNDITSDKKMKFYTGLSTVAMFENIYEILKPFIPTIDYWEGPKKYVSQIVRPRRTVVNKIRKLTPRNALLLTLMRVRLGILNEDLADRFCISPATCSKTFKTWIRVLSQTLGAHLVKWLPVESVKENMPQIFRKAGYGKVRVILDCTEVFIERPKSLNAQALTWSDYKSHNTFKFLVGITPTGFISFLSDSYGGRASDRFICQDSGIFECLDPYDEVMADRGFQIQEELLLKFCTLSVPPGARLKSQMTSTEVKKTKEIANLRIHVERAINRLKTFRILKNVIPVTMLHHCDDIVRTCAALCNLKPLLFAESANSD